jgi:hypothetical protein
MRDQVDCDITMYVYAAIEFIEKAMNKTGGSAKVLVHCYKVRINLKNGLFRVILVLLLCLQVILCGSMDSPVKLPWIQ